MTNLLVGEIKSIKRRVQTTAHLIKAQIQLQGKHVHKEKAIYAKGRNGSLGPRLGTTIEKFEPRVITIQYIGDEITPKTLVERSKRRLKRLAKKDTLY